MVLEQAASMGKAAADNLAVLVQFGEELGKGGAHVDRLDALEARHRRGEATEAGLVELGQHRAGGLGAENADDHCGLLLARQAGTAGCACAGGGAVGPCADRLARRILHCT